MSPEGVISTVWRCPAFPGALLLRVEKNNLFTSFSLGSRRPSNIGEVGALLDASYGKTNGRGTSKARAMRLLIDFWRRMRLPEQQRYIKTILLTHVAVSGINRVNGKSKDAFDANMEMTLNTDLPLHTQKMTMMTVGRRRDGDGGFRIDGGDPPSSERRTSNVLSSSGR